MIVKMKRLIQDERRKGKGKFLRRQGSERNGWCVVAIFERQTHISVVMGNIGFVVHHKKLPETHLVNLSSMLSVMFNQ